MKTKSIKKAIKKLKKLGINHMLHFNEFTNKWSVFKNGDWSPTAGTPGPRGEGKSPLKAVKKYVKTLKVNKTNS